MAKSSPTKFLGAAITAATSGSRRRKKPLAINPPPGNIDINAGGLGAVMGSMLTKKQKFGEPKTPFMMKGSPFQRNFGISPLKQGSEHQTMDPQDMFGGTSTTPTEGDLLKQRLREKIRESGSKQGSAWANIK